MGDVELRRIIGQVTKELAPSRIEARVEDEDILHIFVVSEQFSGFPISRRFERLSQLFETQGVAVAEKFTLVFQAWTKAELASIEDDGTKGSKQDGSQGNRHAAKPAEV
jgi:hypothetical protein